MTNQDSRHNFEPLAGKCSNNYVGIRKWVALSKNIVTIFRGPSLSGDCVQSAGGGGRPPPGGGGGGGGGGGLDYGGASELRPPMIKTKLVLATRIF